ncbi:MAG: hypothetical protein MZV63_14300 [Marinilabiliales bacterium]|nr:hypothetical protein [Marinilabiliales bacterium]
MNWGFVRGKTQTVFPWGSKEGGPEPAVWFHDVLRPDGAPYLPAEADAHPPAGRVNGRVHAGSRSRRPSASPSTPGPSRRPSAGTAGIRSARP